MANETEAVKFYYDYKSPFTYLAFEPALALERSHRVRVRCIPFPVDLHGAYGGELEQRTDDNWFKVRYLYADARRFANERGIIIRGPQKLFDSRLALQSGIYADSHGRFREYSALVFERFFKRELDLENPSALAATLAEAGVDHSGFADFALSRGPAALTEAIAEGERDRVFGVPTIIAGNEPFWGNDRVEWVIKKLDAMGLRRPAREGQR
jgi:2-hydroxychromene-2-carboxylate isomerase